jgi:nitrate reductase assembly molybdenum cofactor insertion protein NarJ
MNGPLDARQRELLNEAAEWRLISLLLDCPAEGWPENVAGLAAEVRDPELRRAAEAAQGEVSPGAYHSLFGPGGPVAPREVSHRRRLEFGTLLAELQSYYDAFGYQPQTLEPADHITVETGFLAYLKLKECYALACNDSERAAIAAEAAERFLQDHLAGLALPVAAALERSGIGYLECAAKALCARVPKVAPELPVLVEAEG